MDSGFQLICLAGFGILPCISMALTGLGFAIIFQIIWQLANLAGFELADDFVLGVALVGVGSIPISIIMVFTLWQKVDFRLSALLGIPAALSSLIGVEVLVTFDQTWLRRGLGMLLLFTYISLSLKRVMRSEPWNPENVKTAETLLTPFGIMQVLLVSLVAGLGRGLFSIGGPPIMIWTALNGIPKDLCRANVCASLVIQLPVTLTYLLVVRNVWKDEHLSYYSFYVGGGLLGLMLGMLIAKRMVEKSFQVLITCLVLVAGSFFVSTGMEPQLLRMLVVLICLSSGIAFGTVVFWCRPVKPELKRVESVPTETEFIEFNCGLDAQIIRI